MNTFIRKLLVLTTLTLPLLPVQNTVKAQNEGYIDNSIYKNLPFDMPKVETTLIPPTTRSASLISEPKGTALH